MIRNTVALILVLLLAVPAAARDRSGPVSAAEGWIAWIDEAPPGPRVLHVTGRVELPTPNHRVRLAFAHMERSNPPTMVLSLDIEAPDGPVAQILTWHRAHLAIPGFADDPAAIRITHRGRTIADLGMLA